VLVQFKLEGQKGSRRYIGRILEIHSTVSEDGSNETKYLMDFVRPERTRDDCGFIYCFPHVRDNKTECEPSQIVRKVTLQDESKRGGLEI